MAQLFRKGANSAFRFILGAMALGIFGFWGIGYAIYRSPYTTLQNVPRTQTVPFSHQHHVSGLGLDCRYCHTSVEESAFAGIPSTETCMTCHSKVWTDAPMLAPVRQSFAQHEPLEWNRVHQLPDFVFFNHSVHVQKGIGCAECHGRVDQMPLTWQAASLRMEWCLQCHRNPAAYVRPRDKVFDMSYTPPRNQETFGKKLVAEYKIRSLTRCSTCHR